jgi:alpha-tubulin suppressor-like RCC1 family protein
VVTPQTISWRDCEWITQIKEMNNAVSLVMTILLIVNVAPAPSVQSDPVVQDWGRPTNRFIQIDSGGERTCALSANRELYCWGTNLTTTEDILVPTKVNTSRRWSTFSAGGSATCAIDLNRALYCWGGSLYGGLGLGDILQQELPARVGSLSAWSSVSVANHHTCGILRTGELYCWGLNTTVQLGLGDEVNRYVPTQVGAFAKWKAVGTGDQSTCAITVSNLLYCWGMDGDLGILGIGALPDGEYMVSVPTQVAPTLRWNSVEVGNVFACGTTTGSALYCWGLNRYGELGLGFPDGTVQNVPARVGYNLQWSQVTVSNGYHACGVTTSKASYCWGMNQLGELGLGDAIQRSAPVPLPIAPAFTSISAGVLHTCALSSAGGIFCWGYNSDGELGVNDRITRSTPTPLFP